MQNENAKLRSSKSSYEVYKYKYEPPSPAGTNFKPQKKRFDTDDEKRYSPKETQIYTPEFILSCKPNITEFPKEYQLKTQGFVMLNHFFQNERVIETNNHRKTRTLRVHDKRFIPSVMRKQYVEGDEEEERKNAVQTCLNRLNFKNSTGIIDNLKELRASNDLIVDLLLDRAAADDDMPERNSHLRNFANFAIQIANEDNDFKNICQTKSLNKYDELVNKSSQELNINVIQCLIVWISYLVMGRVIKRKQYFRCLEFAVKKQPPDIAVGIIRASYFTCGKFLDDNKWTEYSTFYHFMENNNPSTGYLLFLRNDLFSFRKSGWNNQFFIQNEDQPSSILAKSNSHNKNEQTQNQSFLREKLLDIYTNWYGDPEYGTPRVPPQATFKDVVDAVIINYATEQKKIQPQIEDYATWFGSLIKNAEIDNKELPGLLKEALNQVKPKNSQDYDEFMIGFFTILGGLYEAEQIDFKSIASLGALSKIEYINAVGKMTYIDQKEISEYLYPSTNNNNKASSFTPQHAASSDDSVIAALVTITSRSENADITTDYGKAVDLSVIAYSCLEEKEDENDPNAVFDEHKDEIIDASKKMPVKLATEVWNKIILSSQMSPEFINKAKNYFDVNILQNTK